MNETLKGFLQAVLFMWCVWWAMVSLSSGYEWNLIDGVLVVGCAVHYFSFYRKGKLWVS